MELLDIVVQVEVEIMAFRLTTLPTKDVGLYTSDFIYKASRIC